MLNTTTPALHEDDMKKAELDAMTTKQLREVVTKANDIIQQRKEGEIIKGRALMQEIAGDLGVSLFELLGVPQPPPPRAKKGNGTKSPAKIAFQLPGGQTWSGRGRAPQPVKDLVGASGVTDSGFLTDEGKATLEQYRVQ